MTKSLYQKWAGGGLLCKRTAWQISYGDGIKEQYFEF